MLAILDTFPYPWADPAAQHLHIVLANLFPDQPDAVNIAARAGLTPSRINSRQAPTNVWMDILDLAGRSGVTRGLVQQAFDLLGAQSPERPFLAGLLANTDVSIDAEPRNAKNAPNFFAGTDDVTQPEALLYYDDLTVQIGRLPGLVTTLQRLLALSPAVCRLSVEFNGVRGHGTGFRIGETKLLTNWHVVHDINGTRATAATAEFGYEDDGKGGVLQSKLVPCDIASIIADRKDDWAVITATGPLDAAWPVLPLPTADAPAIGDATYIIQHPGGARKRIGFVRNRVTGVEDRVVHYLTDTQQGSSGSPVFNAQGQLIALHHAGGRPQQVIGIPPVKKNEGIRIGIVAAALTARNIVLT